jgi:anaerobic selenocysteine-containing dehydrogenase
LQLGTGDFSVSAWVRFDPAIEQDMMIVAHGNLAILGGKGIDLMYRPGRVNKPLVFRINDGASSEGVFLAAQQVVGGH